MNSSTPAVLEFNGEVTSTSASLPLRESVKTALENYLSHLDGQIPVKLYELVLVEIEAPLFEFVMKLTKKNQSKAAKLLGISRGTLRKKLRQYNLDN